MPRYEQAPKRCRFAVILLRPIIAATKTLRGMIISRVTVDREVSIVFRHAHSAQCILAGSLTEATSGVFCTATQ